MILQLLCVCEQSLVIKSCMLYYCLQIPSVLAYQGALGRGTSRVYAYQDSVLLRENHDHLEDAKAALEHGNVSTFISICTYLALL